MKGGGDLRWDLCDGCPMAEVEIHSTGLDARFEVELAKEVPGWRSGDEVQGAKRARKDSAGAVPSSNAEGAAEGSGG